MAVSALVEAMRAADELALLLDYDGTLVPFAVLPGDAAPDADLLELLARLAARPRTFVSVVSGRPREALESFLGSLPVALFAEHAFWTRTSRAAEWRTTVDAQAPEGWKP